MQRPPLHSKPDTFTAPLPERSPFAAMNAHDESSDGLEEGELSEPLSLVSPSSNGVQMSDDEGRRIHSDGDTTCAITLPVVLSSTYIYAILTKCF